MAKKHTKKPKQLPTNQKMLLLQAFLNDKKIGLSTETNMGHRFLTIAKLYFAFGKLIGIKMQPRIKVT